MKKIINLLILSFVFNLQNGSYAQNVGIGTTAPIARLHVTDSNVIFSAPQVLVSPAGFTTPVNGPGTRLMWLPKKSAFRVGTVVGTGWDGSLIGTWSFASGNNTIAAAENSTASGYYTSATGLSSTAIGHTTTASGDYSTAMGRGTLASGYYSIAGGNTTVASGDVSISLGVSTIASGYNSTAIGYLSKAIGDGSTAMGYNTAAVGNYSTAMGLGTNSNGNLSTAMGSGTIAKSYSSLAIGQYNDSIAGTSPDANVSTDPVFYVGNGISGAVRHNAMLVYKNGNMVLKNPTTVSSDPVGFTVPVSGPGTRLMWLPEKSAFRVGSADGTQWDAPNIGLYSFASGAHTIASGNYSSALGENTTASGVNSTSMGYLSTASGVFSTAMGFLTTASGNFSTAMGYNTIASGDYSIVLGKGTIAKSYGSLAIGANNDTLSGTSATNWINTDPLFYIGNGNPAGSTRSNALVVYKNADVDINGYTRLGKQSEGAPTIKTKKITGTGPAVNGSVPIVHGLNASKILSVSVLMEFGSGPAETIPPFYTISAGYEYQYQVRTADIFITNKTGNSANIAAKPVKILITYEE